MDMIDLHIGIDPGESNGVALYDKKNGLRVYTMNFWKLVDYINNTIVPAYKRDMTVVPHFYVENPGLNSFMYHQRIDNKNKAVALKIAQNVGSNKADAKRIIELIKNYEMIVEEIKPNSNSQKWSADYFNKLTGLSITCSQHARDAAKLIARYWLK